jgi:hypothetical protein
MNFFFCTVLFVAQQILLIFGMRICFKRVVLVLLFVQSHQMWTVLLSLSEIQLLLESCCSGIRMQDADCCYISLQIGPSFDSRVPYQYFIFYEQSVNVCLRTNRT